MTIRDTKELSSLIKENLELGLKSTVLEKFEKRKKIQIFCLLPVLIFFMNFLNLQINIILAPLTVFLN